MDINDMHPFDIEWTEENIRALNKHNLVKLHHEAFGGSWESLRAKGKAELLEKTLAALAERGELERKADHDMAEAYKHQVDTGERSDG